MSELGSVGARVEVRDSSHVLRIRDYFRRLGADATVEAGGTVAVEFPEGSLLPDETIDDYVRSWSTVNRVGARILGPDEVGAVTVNVASAPPAAAAPPPRLGNLLVSKGYITQEQLSEALVESKASGEILGKTLIKHGYIFESELARTLAEQWSLPYVNLASVGVDPAAAQRLPRALGEEVGAIPVRRIQSAVQVAFVDPSDERAMVMVRVHIPSVAPAVADHSDIVMAWRSMSR